MNITKILSASVLAGAVLLSATACSAPDAGEKSNAGANASATATPTANVDASAVATPSETAAVSDTKAVVDVVNGFYTYVLNKENADDIQKAAESLQGNAAQTGEPTDEQIATLVKNLPEGFKYFDTSSSDLIKNAYGQLYIVSVTNTSDMSIVAPEEAATVEGDTATVDPVKFTMTVDGEKITNGTTSSDPIKLKKNADGAWVMVASSSMSGSGEASSK